MKCNGTQHLTEFVGLRFASPNLRTTNPERSHNLVGWTQCNVTTHFTRLCWVSLRFTQPTNYEPRAIA
ncbi:hypothetical protein [Limnospira platensis]|uniref:hypothetical protein n=1 Tax=Limnospira platensis TaxID=118562 RepID=UPI00130522EF|nr:hypothetical protein [Arthrospira platensis NCB002]